MIKAIEGASRRTKNRVEQHNLVEISEDDLKLTNKPTALQWHYLYGCKDEGCRWIGWLPHNELEEVE